MDASPRDCYSRMRLLFNACRPSGRRRRHGRRALGSTGSHTGDTRGRHRTRRRGAPTTRSPLFAEPSSLSAADHRRRLARRSAVHHSVQPPHRLPLDRPPPGRRGSGEREPGLAPGRRREWQPRATTRALVRTTAVARRRPDSHGTRTRAPPHSNLAGVRTESSAPAPTKPAQRIQPRDAFAAHTVAFAGHLAVDPRRAVGAAAVFVDLADLGQQLDVAQRADGARPRQA